MSFSFPVTIIPPKQTLLRVEIGSFPEDFIQISIGKRALIQTLNAVTVVSVIKNVTSWGF